MYLQKPNLIGYTIYLERIGCQFLDFGLIRATIFVHLCVKARKVIVFQGMIICRMIVLLLK